MRNPDKIEIILDKIKKVWSVRPDLRFGQVVEVIKKLLEQEDIFYVEDEDINMVLDIWLEKDKEGAEEESFKKVGSFDTKVYLVQFNNGESFQEDFSEWVDTKVYLTKQECVDSILAKGYEYQSYSDYYDTEMYSLKPDEPWEEEWIARVVELEVEIKLSK